ncbi:hypothetical protein [Longimycelium tulufanense]|nr:hypothetical protein [Longimycelium tulufanense]
MASLPSRAGPNRYPRYAEDDIDTDADVRNTLDNPSLRAEPTRMRRSAHPPSR